MSVVPMTHRLLACVLCQQRKIKCDRNSPCANCTRSSVQCVPATRTPRKRRRRIPDREVLERLERYESLLHKNNIEFDALSDEKTEDNRSKGTEGVNKFEPKKIWHALAQRSGDSEDDSGDDLGDTTIKKAWDQFYEGNDLLFAVWNDVNLSTLHPPQVHIFRLWQIYLDNVNPLLKVTHTPTLQARIIDAASNVTAIEPNLEALMFRIYCIAVQSLGRERNESFGSKEDLRKYRLGCQQALLECHFLRSSDRDCLTALYLYLISVRPDIDPRSLSSILAVAIRIAQRMGIHNESTFTKYTALEAEMGRILWWSIVIFDNRICEMSDLKTTMLNPTWDCKTPSNINDFDILPEMMEMPASHQQPTEALFDVVRSEMADFVRHSSFHLEFTNPSLKVVAQQTPSVDSLEKKMEERHLRLCHPENPLHFMIIWTTRGYLARLRLLSHWSKSLQSSDAVPFALYMLECDTKLMTSPLLKGYLWFVEFHFPFPAYIHLLQDLKRRPLQTSERTWDLISSNYRAYTTYVGDNENPLFKVFSGIVLQTWKACQDARPESETPWIVSDMQAKLQTPRAPTENTAPMSMELPMDLCNDPYGWQFCTGLGDVSGQELELDISQVDWSAVNWNPMYA